MNWTILKYETGRHAAIPNSLCRLGIPCILPMVEEYNQKAMRKVMKPALTGLLFMPAIEESVRLALDTVRYAELVWRDGQGHLITIADRDIQFFLDQLDKREKKEKKSKASVNMSDAAELDWFMLYVAKFGLSEAIKRFGRDLRVKEAA